MTKLIRRFCFALGVLGDICCADECDTNLGLAKIFVSPSIQSLIESESTAQIAIVVDGKDMKRGRDRRSNREGDRRLLVEALNLEVADYI